jgi:hypothetical protein
VTGRKRINSRRLRFGLIESLPSKLIVREIKIAVAGITAQHRLTGHPRNLLGGADDLEPRPSSTLPKILREGISLLACKRGLWEIGRRNALDELRAP